MSHSLRVFATHARCLPRSSRLMQFMVQHVSPSSRVSVMFDPQNDVPGSTRSPIAMVRNDVICTRYVPMRPSSCVLITINSRLIFFTVNREGHDILTAAFHPASVLLQFLSNRICDNRLE